MICNRPDEVTSDWVFGYGSLIWNPEFEFASAELARVHGYHRAFCVRSTLYRGTPQQPGVVLGLDRGGSCVGVAYRLSAASRSQAIVRLFEREVPDPTVSIYVPRIVEVRLGSGEAVRALTFVADRSRPTYQRLSDEQILDRLLTCHGLRGPNRDYAVNTLAALQARGVFDAHLRRVVTRLERHPVMAEDRAPEVQVMPTRRIRPRSAPSTGARMRASRSTRTEAQ